MAKQAKPGTANHLAPFLLALAGGACIVPQDVVDIPDIPPKKNSPPFILMTAMVPEESRATVIAGSSCASSPEYFQVQVLDEDSEPAFDRISHHWYFDRTADSDPMIGDPIDLGDAGVPFATPIRTLRSPRRLLEKLAAVPDTTQRHIVEVFVTDGDFTSVPGQVEPPSFVDSFAWFIEVQRCR